MLFRVFFLTVIAISGTKKDFKMLFRIFFLTVIAISGVHSICSNYNLFLAINNYNNVINYCDSNSNSQLLSVTSPCLSTHYFILLINGIYYQGCVGTSTLTPSGTMGVIQYYWSNNNITTVCAYGDYYVGSTGCGTCGAGYIPSYNQQYCVACDVGTYESDTIHYTCTQCSKGFYSTITAATACTACIGGEYASITGSTSCSKCTSGTYSTGGTSSCLNCARDTYTSSTGMSSCITCATGYHTPTGATKCYSCTAGKIFNYNTIACDSCSSGFFSIQGDTVCTTCTPGSISASSSSTCTQCTPGYYQSTTQCLACTSGKYSSQSGATVCLNCAPGSISSTGASWCTGCIPGTYITSTGSTLCLQCPLGTYTSATGFSTCSNCPANTYAGAYGDSSCIACNTSTEYSAPGSSICLACNYNFNCLDGPYMLACNKCPTNYYIITYPPTYCIYQSSFTETIPYCLPCKTSSDCVAGTYLNFQCDGTNYVKNACLKCSTGACENPDLYRRNCTSTQNSLCTQTYTQCSSGYYLQGYTNTQDGTCQPCTTCSGPDTTLQQCSQYKPRVCAAACDENTPCLAGVCVFAAISNLNLCVLCPTGYSVDGFMCRPCNKGAICDSNGVYKCDAQCPWYSMPTCSSCIESCTTAPQLPYSNAEITDYNLYGSCTPTTRCQAGYYLNYYFKQCLLCDSLEQGNMFISNGLVDNTPSTCLQDIIPANTGNQPGYYGTEQTKCPMFKTSEYNNAATILDCYTCPIDPNMNIIMTDYTYCIWDCMYAHTKVGSICLPTDETEPCRNQPGTVVLDSGRCVFYPPPWQKPGYEYQTDTVSTTTNLFAIDAIVSYNPFTLSHPNININSNHKEYYKAASRNTMTISKASVVNIIDTLGPICSVAYTANENIYLTLCNVSMIFYLNTNNKIRRLIGRNYTGYNEGMKNDALFESELYVAATSNNQKIIVLDTFNCVVREIVVGPNGAGDFRTTSHLLYGQVYGNTPVCDTLEYPRYLWPLHTIQGGIWAFLNYDSQICQIHMDLRKVACSSVLLDDNKILKSVRASNDSQVVVLIYTLDKTYHWNAGNPCLYQDNTNCDTYKCPDDYTSKPGTSCTIYAPWLDGAIGGYYIQNGIAYTCTGSSCTLGYYAGPCARNASSQCLPCITNTPYNIEFLLPGDCTYGYLPPCPVNMYVLNSKCVLCPDFMFSTIDRNTGGFETCECPYPLQKQGQDCVLASNSQLYPMFVQSSCEYYEYLHPYTLQCTMCIQNPCTLPLVGQYITSCFGQALNCIIPAHSTATSIGFFNNPTSCNWKCNPGFQSNGTHCIACNNNINTTLAYYYDACSYDFYF